MDISLMWGRRLSIAKSLGERTAFSDAVARYTTQAVKAKAAAKGKGPTKAPLPQKQQFRKRFKEAAQARGDATQTLSQREALVSALFEVRNPAAATAAEEEPDAALLEQRACIAKAWSRMQMMRLHAQSMWERSFLASKLEAIKELRKVSPELAKAAEVVDYSIPPTHRRVPTETPPDPAKFPFYHHQ